MGIDPGLVATGYGIIEVAGRTPFLVEAGVIRSRAKDPLEKKLLDIFTGATEVMEEFAPAVAVIEELFSTYTHPRTAILMGHARGVVYAAAAARTIPVVSYASTRVKNSLTGHGRASKQQVQRMVQHAFGLPDVPRPPDAADALAVALCHHNALLHEVGRAAAARRGR